MHIKTALTMQQQQPPPPPPPLILMGWVRWKLAIQNICFGSLWASYHPGASKNSYRKSVLRLLTTSLDMTHVSYSLVGSLPRRSFSRSLVTDRQTDQWNDRPMDRQSNGRTDYVRMSGLSLVCRLLQVWGHQVVSLFLIKAEATARPTDPRLDRSTCL